MSTVRSSAPRRAVGYKPPGVMPSQAIWAVTGAIMLIVFGLLPWSDALKAVGKGTDVYLFLTGVMLLAELARIEGLFDFLAGRAARMAGGSATKLFALVYAVGTVVTSVYVERRYSGGSHACCVCSDQGREGKGPSSLSFHLCIYSKRGKLRSADWNSKIRKSADVQHF
jgi:hypothetical protein